MFTYHGVEKGHVITISWQCVNTNNMRLRILCDRCVNYFIVLLIFICWLCYRHERI